MVQDAIGRQENLHRHDVEARKKSFARISETQTAALKAAVMSEIDRDGRFLFIASCDKFEHRGRHGQKPVDDYLPADLYLMLFTFTVERFTSFLEQRDARGSLVIESRGRSEDVRLNKRLADMLAEGTQYFEPWQFNDRLSPTPVFRTKQHREGGL